MEENLFIVRYCIEETYRQTDFEKAFDSVKRLALVRALKFYRCEPRLIDMIVDLYV